MAASLQDLAATRREPGLWLDAGTVVLVVALAVGSGLWQGDDPQTPMLSQLFVALPLLARRRHPLAVFLATAAVSVAQFLVTDSQAGEIALLVALYSVGAYERRRWALLSTVAVATVGGSAAVVAWSPGGDTVQTVVLLAGTVTAAWVTGVYVHTRRAFQVSSLERVRAEERDQLSREIHDIVAHNLSVMIALGDGATVALERDPGAARAALEQSTATGREALNEIRRLLGDLRDHSAPSRGPQPGLAGLGELVSRVRAADLPVELVTTGRPRELSAGAQLAVYRIVQEGLTNVLKHAPSATRARVELAYEVRDVVVTVTDDGFSRADTTRSTEPGHGLLGMRERAATFAGDVEAGPVEPRGWRVRARLSLPVVMEASSS